MSDTGHAAIPRDEAGDRGFTLIEVVVALALFAVLSTAVLAVVQDSVGLARTNQGRVTASALAGRVLESARMADPTVPPPASEQVISGAIPYAVTRTVESVHQAGSTWRCGVSPSRTVAQRLHVAVDWPTRPPGVSPVRLSSVRTVDMNALAPDAATLYAVVENTDGAGVSGVTVTATPSGATATTITTDTNGCAVFPSLPPGDYQITISRAGYADPQGVTQPTRGPVTLTRGGVTEELFVYSPFTPESPASGLSVTQSCASNSAPAFRSASSARSSGTSIALPKPSGVQGGDFMLAHLAFPGAPSPSTIGTATGWTLLNTTVSTGGTTQAVFFRWATSSDANSYTWGYSTTSKSVGGITAFSGVHRTRPINAWAGQATDVTGKQVTAPPVTTTLSNTKLVGLFSLQAEGTWSEPPGMTERYDVSTTGNPGDSNVSVEAAGQALGAAGATGTRTATHSAGGRGVGHLVALSPVLIPSADLSWTATSWPSADGYYLRRTVGGVLQRDWSVRGRTTTSSTDGPLVNATTYTYELAAIAGSAETDPVTATLTPSC